jgi:hypothetical protein
MKVPELGRDLVEGRDQRGIAWRIEVLLRTRCAVLDHVLGVGVRDRIGKAVDDDTAVLAPPASGSSDGCSAPSTRCCRTRARPRARSPAWSLSRLKGRRTGADIGNAPPEAQHISTKVIAWKKCRRSFSVQKRLRLVLSLKSLDPKQIIQDATKFYRTRQSYIDPYRQAELILVERPRY